MTSRNPDLRGWAREALLTVGAVVGGICLLVAVGSALFGLRPLVFQSGSMSPTIGTGALALSHEVEASSLHVGQVVSVPTGDGERVTHRIVGIAHDGAITQLELRGDANKVSDPHTYRVTKADVVVFHVPWLGYAIGWLVGPVGLFLLGLYAAFLASVLLRRRPPSEDHTDRAPEPEGESSSTPGRHTRVLKITGLSALVVFGTASGVLVQHQVTPTLAAWTDGVTVAGSTLTAKVTTLNPPPLVTCLPGTGQKSVLSWGAVTGATNYRVHTGAATDVTYTVVGSNVLSLDLPNNKTGQTWVEVSGDNQVNWSAPSAKFNYVDAVCTPAL
jgi:signal peptidase I